LLPAIDPHAAPAQPGPETLHVTPKFGFEPAAGVNAAWIVAAAPEFTAAGPDTATVNPLAIVSVMLALALGLATLVAVIVALAGCGKNPGAMYVPPGEIVPTVAFPPFT
jgi:predicted small lipoprotein YifL